VNEIVACWTPFNSFLFPFKGWKPGQPHPVLQRQWIRDRFNLWRKYTYQSIAGQDNGRFVYMVCCNILSKHLTDDIFKDVLSADSRVKLIYHGCKEYHRVTTVLRDQYDRVYAVRIDSDDMYSKDTFSYILKGFPEDQTHGFFLKGYGYSPQAEKLYHYDCCKSGPFYAVKYEKGMYRFDPIDHTYVRRMGACVLEDGHFIVSIHGKNHSSSIKPPYFSAEEIGIGEKRKILRRFM
jgi:hypothetical protein